MLLWHKFVFNKQTYRELTEEYGFPRRTLYRYFQSISNPEKIHKPRTVNLVVDCTFFGDKGKEQWGFMVFRDAKERENLWWKVIDQEKNEYYKQGRMFLIEKGYVIVSVTMDGFRGLPNVFNDIPVQFCHFHQKQIIRRYVTKNPKLEAGKALKLIVEELADCNEKTFKILLKGYIEKYQDFLNEKTTNPLTGKQFFTHKRLRSAIRSLINNLPLLYKYQKHLDLNIPNTTNSLDGHFSHIKDVVRIHRGLSREMKIKLVETILLNSSIAKKKDKN